MLAKPCQQRGDDICQFSLAGLGHDAGELVSHSLGSHDESRIVQKIREKALPQRSRGNTNQGREIVNRIGHTTETRDSLRHLILENRSPRPEYIPRPAMPDELFQPRPSAPPDRARCRPSLPVPGRLRTAALPARRFAGLAAQPAEGKRLRSPPAEPESRKRKKRPSPQDPQLRRP